MTMASFVTDSPGIIGDDTNQRMWLIMDDKEIERRQASELGEADGYAWAQEIAHDDDLNRLSQINLSVIDTGEEAAFAVLWQAVDPNHECTSQDVCAACFGDAHRRSDEYTRAFITAAQEYWRKS